MSTDVQIPGAKGILVDTTGAEIIQEDSPATRDSRGIYLPHYIEPVSHIAIDIGGSLAKLVYFTRSPNPPNGHSFAEKTKPSASVPIHTTSSKHSFVELDLESAGGSWTPKVNGALTPELLTATRNGSVDGTHKRTASGELPESSLRGSTNPAGGIRRGHARGHSLLRRGSLPPNFPGGTLNFVRFETEKVDDLIEFLKDLIKQSAATNHVTEEQMRKGVKVIATGGGAHKYYDLLVEGTGLSVQREEEMECLTTGLGFITSIPDEVFWYSDKLVYEISHQRKEEVQAQAVKLGVDPRTLPRPSPDPPNYQVTFDTAGSPQFPCLLVNIGSGVSIVKVDEDGSFERVSGTSLGGGTLWGLLSLITEATTFDEMLALSEKGDNAAVDMLVGDIYGADYNKIGLKSSTIASSFGKVFKKGAADRKKAFSQEDISKSLLYAISNNIGQIAYMNAEKYGLDRIYFGGCFIRGHAATISCLSYAIRFWSKGTVRAMFLRHEGFLGSIGAWIKNVNAPTPPDSEQASAASTA